jgi:hypothetical protein
MMARSTRLLLLCAAIMAATQVHAQLPIADSASSAAATAHDASIDDYRQHLIALGPIVDACAKARDTRTCDPDLVGLDDRVPMGTGTQAGRRLIRYDWLRSLLSHAQLKDDPPPVKNEAESQMFPGLENARPPRKTIAELLQDAKARLARDLDQAAGTQVTPPAHEQERDALGKVLAGREFRNLEESSARETILEKIANAVNNFFNRVASFSARSPWIGLVVKWGFFAAVCVGLIWGLIQLERRSRIRLVPDTGAPAPGAALARDWQLWLEDARRAAAEGRWREAVHFVYWASISRLESKRLWPADRARTPREYLALVAEEDPRHPGLATLTRSFERIWYGGRAAGEKDYRAAEQLATALISSGGVAGGGAA